MVYISPVHSHPPPFPAPLPESVGLDFLDSVYLSDSNSTPPPFSGGPAPEGGRVGGGKDFILFTSSPSAFAQPVLRAKTSSQKQQFARVAGLGCGCAHWRVCVSARARVSVCAFLFSYRVQC